MKKSVIILAIAALVLYGFVVVVSPDISTIMAAVAGIVVAIFLFGILMLRIKTPEIVKKLPLLNTIPLIIIFLIVPAVFTAVLFIQGKLSVILIMVMISLAFSFFYGFLSIPLAVYHKYEEKKISQKPLSRYLQQRSRS